ncbi:hypothetical protein EBU94_08840 [bacterium]|nr:hypothetical protein [bacterium]
MIGFNRLNPSFNLPLPSTRVFLFVGIGNIFLILQNSGVLLYRLLNNWKYISKYDPLFLKYPFNYKKNFWRISQDFLFLLDYGYSGIIIKNA